nr:type II and III secretion system protein [Nitrosomonas sp.]
AMVRGLVKAKDIYVNEQLNLFIMRDTLEAIRVVERLVSLNDLPEPEVMLEVVILTITRQDTFNLGPKLPQSITAGFVAPAGGAIANAAASVTFDQIKNAGFPNLKNFVVNNQVAIDFAHNFSGTELLANPRIRVKNREAAKIHIGTRQPFFSATVAAGIGGVVTSTPQFIDIGVKLDVEPVIGLYNDITLKVTLEVSDRIGDASGPGGATAPIVSTSNAETLLSLKDGETQIIGGLIRDDDRQGLRGLAGLLNIPGLDRLISNQDIRRDKTELMLMITPHVVRNINQPSNLESEFHYGTANAAGKLPLTITKTEPKSLSLATTGSGRGASAMLSRAAGTLSSSDESEETPNPFARNVEATPMISLQAPPRVGLDKEFTVRVGLIGAKPSVTSEMQLSYDSDMLEALDDEDNSGTRTLKLGKDGTGKTEQLRFKAITANPGTAEISIQNITAEDKDTSESVEVTLPRTANIIIQ